MTKLLFVQASPRGADSKSIRIAETYLDALHAANPHLGRRHRQEPHHNVGDGGKEGGLGMVQTERRSYRIDEGADRDKRWPKIDPDQHNTDQSCHEGQAGRWPAGAWSIDDFMRRHLRLLRSNPISTEIICGPDRVGRR
jgi:hypothetical protein